MKLTLKRIFTCKEYTIGHLYIDDVYICDTLEDTDRGLDNNMSEKEIASKKIKGTTAIPTGTYKVLMNIVSPRFSKVEYYKRICGGKVPRLENVKGFSGVLIHTGNSAKHTEGCLLLGYNKIKGAVVDSRKAFETVYNKLDIANRIGQSIYITIKRSY